jgi:O-antigen/teichoic acid export membrane protein
MLVASQLNFFWLTELAVYIGNGTRRLKESAQLRLIVVCCRFLALLAFAVAGDGRLGAWAVASLVSFGAAAGLCLLYVWRVFGLRPSVFAVSTSDLVEGAPFAAYASTESLVDVSDRPLLVRYGHETDAGIYSLGGRIIQFGYLPLRILMRASDADIFEAGREGTRRALAVTRSLMVPGVVVGIAVGAGVLVCAPIVPLLVGDKYAEAVDTMRLLAVMPLIRAVQYLMGNCLSASNHQMSRVWATVAAAALNFGLNLRLLPTGSWRTAVFTTIVSEVFLAGVLLLVVYGWAWRERNGEAGHEGWQELV